MDRRLVDIYDFISYYEEEKGDLNLFFYYIYDNAVTYDEIMVMLYDYERMKGLDIDYEEYYARYGDRHYEYTLEKVKMVAKDIAQAMKDKTRYKPRHK